VLKFTSAAVPSLHAKKVAHDFQYDPRILVIIGIPDYQLYSETTLFENKPSGQFWTGYATSL
jgi:hypothetical protein